MTQEQHSVVDARCPSCDALNDGSAEWCGQCFRRFERPPALDYETAVRRALAEGARATRSAPEAPALLPQADQDVGALERAFQIGVDGVTWSCLGCRWENPIDAQACATCGAPFRATARKAVAADQRERAGRFAREGAVLETAVALSPVGFAALPTRVFFLVLRRLVRGLFRRYS